MKKLPNDFKEAISELVKDYQEGSIFGKRFLGPLDLYQISLNHKNSWRLLFKIEPTPEGKDQMRFLTVVSHEQVKSFLKRLKD